MSTAADIRCTACGAEPLNGWCGQCGASPTPNRWAAFSDEEVRVIFVEMVTDDCMRYGYSEGDEPAYTIWRELIREIERRGINESV